MKAKKHLKVFDPINLKILSELCSFFLGRGAKELQMSIKDEEDMAIIQITGRVEDIWRDDIEQLDTRLNIERQHEVESYYWQLSGEDEDDDFITVGMMVDKAIVEYKDGLLSVKSIRFK